MENINDIKTHEFVFNGKLIPNIVVVFVVSNNVSIDVVDNKFNLIK